MAKAEPSFVLPLHSRLCRCFAGAAEARGATSWDAGVVRLMTIVDGVNAMKVYSFWCTVVFAMTKYQVDCERLGVGGSVLCQHM